MDYIITDKKLIITLPERIDTAVSPQISEQINTICAQNEHDTLELNAIQLEYISSSGLRILMQLAKSEQNFKMTEVSPDVYNILSMTGFTRIITAEQRLREVSIDGIPVRGKGGIGVVYQLTEDTIIKVFREGTPLSEVQKEITLAKEAFVFGLPTAISFELVRVGNQYGIIHELINAKTLASIINEDPAKAEYYGAKLGKLIKQVHQIKDEKHILPDAVEETHSKIETLRRYFTDKQIDMLYEIYDAIPSGNSVLHCDLHPKNVMVSNGELILIDMGEVCYGNPLQDIAHTFSSMKGLVGNYEEIIGMSEEVSHRCYDSLLRTYLETDDEQVIARRIAQIQVVSYFRNFSWLALSDTFPKEVIDKCKQLFVERIENNIDYIRTILPQLKEWNS